MVKTTNIYVFRRMNFHFFYFKKYKKPFLKQIFKDFIKVFRNQLN